MTKERIVIMGAAGRDFHDFNAVYLDPSPRVVAFTAAQIPGVPVAGKTGTAEAGVNHVYNAWFVCFAPAENPRYVVAVVVEKQLNGFGGSVAAPIAKAVLENLLHG